MDSYQLIRFKGKELPEQYRPMVFSKFLRSLRHGNDYFRMIESKAYYSVYNAYLATILERENSEIILAVLSDDKDVVLGWMLTEPNKLHYIWIDKDQRRQGIGRDLISLREFNTFTQLTNTGLIIWASKYKQATFNPFA